LLLISRDKLINSCCQSSDLSYDDEVPSHLQEEEFRETFTSDLTYEIEYFEKQQPIVPVVRTSDSTPKISQSGEHVHPNYKLL
jgi:hypothetical protein